MCGVTVSGAVPNTKKPPSAAAFPGLVAPDGS
jgi:hypothetical protein